MSDEDVEDAIEQTMEKVADVGDDTKRFTQQESLDFYRAIASDCTTRANLIQSEM